MSPAAVGVSDGARLNLAAQLATTAADLQKMKSARQGKAQDPTLEAALADVSKAIVALCSAVARLTNEVSDTELVALVPHNHQGQKT